MPLLTCFFLGWVWPWAGEFDGFIIIFICFSTRQNLVYRKHPIYCTVRKHLPNSNSKYYFVPETATVLDEDATYIGSRSLGRVKAYFGLNTLILVWGAVSQGVKP